MKKKLLIILSVISIAFLCNACDFNEVLTESLSPNKKNKAVLFSRSVNSTTSLSYHVSILKSNDKVGNDVGNTLIADAPVEFKWIDNNNIVIYINENTNTFKQEKKVGIISVNYVNR